MANQFPLLLNIETSCDETSVALTRGRKILSNEIHSQLELHKDYGGVVPSIAKLAHQQKFDSVLNAALNRAEVSLDDVDAIAVVVGPGLAIALEVGILKAKQLATQYHKPLIAVNHMEGHLLSAFMHQNPSDTEFTAQLPALGLLVSGKHSELIHIAGFRSYRKLGQTLDDACGEAFDKAATMLGLGYPGGPQISKLAAARRPQVQISEQRQNDKVLLKLQSADGEYSLPIPMAQQRGLDMSYSGLKTALKQLINTLGGVTDRYQTTYATGEQANLTAAQIQDLATLFETAAISVLIRKLDQALGQGDYRELWLGGGVIANTYLRAQVDLLVEKYAVLLRLPESLSLMTDNAAMHGAPAALMWQAGEIYKTEHSFDQIDRLPNLSLEYNQV